MNSNMVKPEKFGHLLFVNHFTIPLIDCVNIWKRQKQPTMYFNDFLYSIQ